MTITITLDTSNAAFDEHGGAEIVRLIHHVAMWFNTYGAYEDEVCLLALNGNRVGNVVVKGR